MVAIPAATHNPYLRIFVCIFSLRQDLGWTVTIQFLTSEELRDRSPPLTTEN
jgi:hypothetical protein